MKRLIYLTKITYFIFTLHVAAFSFGKDSSLESGNLNKLSSTSDIWLNANRMNGVFNNNGVWLYDYKKGDWGLEWPKGSDVSPIFAAGQWIGAKVNGKVRVAAVQHSASEFQPGLILTNGADPPVAADPEDATYRIYTIRADGSGDWDSWPVEQGAPVEEDGAPQLLGDQLIFSVFNDLMVHEPYGSEPLGVEVRQTAWEYSRQDNLGDVIFIKWQIVNKSNNDWDSTFFGLWCDADLGYAGDDAVGCDTMLNLGFCYNRYSFDDYYSDFFEDGVPPAVGFRLLQGPLVYDSASNVCLPDGRMFLQKRMLLMTSFATPFKRGGPTGNPLGNKSSIWNYLKGRWKDGMPFTYGGLGYEEEGETTKYMFTGDPEKGAGWICEYNCDFRYIVSTGPFSMPQWNDTNSNGIPDLGEPGVQEIIAAVICARGFNNLNSVTRLKRVSKKVEICYNYNFNIFSPPAKPEVCSSELPNEVILSWDDRSERLEDGSVYESVEPFVAYDFGKWELEIVGEDTIKKTFIDDSTYNFYGYSIYQFSDAFGSDPVLVEHWDLGRIKSAEDYSFPRFIRILDNINPIVGPVGNPLINGKEYYFGVCAEAYLKYSVKSIIKSDTVVVSCVPHYEPGARYTCAYLDTVFSEHVTVIQEYPLSEGSVTAFVVDPSKVTGHDYKVTFTTEDDESVTWDVIDVTLGDTVLADQTNQRGDDAYTVVDGLKIVVAGPPPGIKSIVELDPATLEVYDSNLWGSLNNYGRSQEWPVFIVHESRDNALSLARVDRFGTMTPKDYEIIFTDDDSTLAHNYLSDVVLRDTLTDNPSFLPFTFWRIDLDGTRTRLAVTVYDIDGDGTWNRSWDGIWGPAFDLLYVYDNAEYKPENVATYISTDDGTVDPGYGPRGVVYPAVNRFALCMYVDIDGYASSDMLDGDGYFWGPPHAGEHIRINTNKPNAPNDVFEFTAPAAKSVTSAYEKEDLEKIRVVPNPYYGYHSGEMNIFECWVQFTYLPEKCTIRIFDLAGNQIRKLEKDDPNTTFMRWDLSNEYELPVASSIYIYHVDVPGVGEKVGKIAVFTPNERLEIY